jgi:hypothetical protein
LCGTFRTGFVSGICTPELIKRFYRSPDPLSVQATARSFLYMTERTIQISRHGLYDAPDTGLSSPTTPEERIALVETLTREAWALTGRKLPEYLRHDAPVRVRRLSPTQHVDARVDTR